MFFHLSTPFFLLSVNLVFLSLLLSTLLFPQIVRPGLAIKISSVVHKEMDVDP
jgi:hypothetical protein